jgi:hypothetical protein
MKHTNGITSADDLHTRIGKQVLSLLAQGPGDPARLNNALRLLAKYRSKLLQDVLVREAGTTVQGGPFAGMLFNEQAAEGCHIPKLLGCYEEELHDLIYGIKDARYDTLLNIGCAEGYYAVGLKRMAPDLKVIAFDIDPRARQACLELAERNGVEVEVGEEFKSADFERFEDSKVVVWCDIEGAELDLLDPAVSPSLNKMDLVVELHPTATGHAFNILPARFKKHHDVEIRWSQGHNPRLPRFLRNASHLDQLLAQWEWRSAPTPWAIIRQKRLS